MLINESIVFPPGGSKMVPLPFPASLLLYVRFPLIFTSVGRAAALWRGCGARPNIMILISSNQEPSAQLKNSNHAQRDRRRHTAPRRAAAAAGDRNISTYSDCVECGAE